jgi:hypothetical protein
MQRPRLCIIHVKSFVWCALVLTQSVRACTSQKQRPRRCIIKCGIYVWCAFVFALSVWNCVLLSGWYGLSAVVSVCVCVCAALHPTPPRTIPAFQLRLARERQTESQIEQTRPDQTRPGRETRSDQTSLRPPHDYWPSRCHVGGADAVWRACQVACQFARLPVCLLVRSSACLHGCLSACLSVRPAH